MKTSFELNDYHFNAFGVYSHIRELKIERDFIFLSGGIPAKLPIIKRVLPMLMIKVNTMIVKYKKKLGQLKTNLGKIKFLEKKISIQCVKKQFSRRDFIGSIALGET